MQINLTVRMVVFAAILVGLTVAAQSYVASASGGPAQVLMLSGIPALLLAILFARNLSKSLARISAAVRATAAGDLECRVSNGRRDEIGDLARDFDRMVEQFKRYREQFDSAQEKAALTSRALVTSGRLAAVGQLAAGVAHEINNPLTYVRANLGQLREDWQVIRKALEEQPTTEETRLILGEGEEMIDESLEGVERAVAIVRDIKGFAHSGPDHRGDVELNSLLDSVVRVASPQLGAGTRIIKDYADSICVPGSPQELKQVFLNLIVNACQAIEGTGTIRVETHEDHDVAIIVIEDDGIGIDEGVAERMFDPFFTTKPVGQGTGLGLSISHEIIMRHQGEIRVQSTWGEGTRFSVHLPLHE